MQRVLLPHDARVWANYGSGTARCLQADCHSSDSCRLVPIPGNFDCPISDDSMQHPVATVDGQIYERECIEDWFRTSLEQGRHPTSPSTNEELPCPALLPLECLQAAIESYVTARPELKNARADWLVDNNMIVNGSRVSFDGPFHIRQELEIAIATQGTVTEVHQDGTCMVSWDSNDTDSKMSVVNMDFLRVAQSELALKRGELQMKERAIQEATRNSQVLSDRLRDMESRYAERGLNLRRLEGKLEDAEVKCHHLKADLDFSSLKCLRMEDKLEDKEEMIQVQIQIRSEKDAMIRDLKGKLEAAEAKLELEGDMIQDLLGKLGAARIQEARLGAVLRLANEHLQKIILVQAWFRGMRCRWSLPPVVLQTTKSAYYKNLLGVEDAVAEVDIEDEDVTSRGWIGCHEKFPTLEATAGKKPKRRKQ